MSQRPDADLIIIGGGCAGLSLASRLARARSGLSVRILEPRDHYTEDRSWCFWRPDIHDLSPLVSTRWSAWSFSRTGEVPAIQTQNALSYQLVRSADFYSNAIDHITHTPKIGLELGVRADRIHTAPNGLRVETSNGQLNGRYVIDTRPPTARMSALATLFQCFASYELCTSGGHGLDPSLAELMTDMRTDGQGFVFSYILPLDRERVIVEVTRFSFDPVSRDLLTRDLNELLVERSWQEALIERQSFGVLPMGLPRSQSPVQKHVYKAGIGTGGLRAASGYGFLRIQNWADICTHRLLSGQTPVSHFEDPWHRQIMRQMFLRAFQSKPDRAPGFFMNLARTLQPMVMARFMSDRSSLGDLFQITTRLPLLPFLKAVIKPQPTKEGARSSRAEF